jgi:flagellar biosynthetic protein FlhF
LIIKKYIADTMNEAINLIKFELGPEAVIISKRSIKQKGFMGIFLPAKLEVTAAVDENVKDEKPKVEGISSRERIVESREFEQELNAMKQMLKKLTVNNDDKNSKRIGVKKLLLQRDVSEEVVNTITEAIKSREEYKNVSRIPDSAYADEIKGLLKVDSSMNGRIYAFIGPTGVGKTTTIAKVAAMQSLNNKKKVGLITIDTYRIGAVEQLKIYADILGLPFEVINSVGDIERSMYNLRNCDMILVDTTGRSIKNVMQLSELKLYLDRLKPDNIFLVLSMTTKYQDMLQIMRGFEIMKYNRVVLTKFDETTTYGSALNAACSTRSPIAYITVGQNVPDDIREAESDKLLDLIIGGGSI